MVIPYQIGLRECVASTLVLVEHDAAPISLLEQCLKKVVGGSYLLNRGYFLPKQLRKPFNQKQKKFSRRQSDKLYDQFVHINVIYLSIFLKITGI